MPSVQDLQSSNPPITVIIDSIQVIQQQAPATTVVAQAPPPAPTKNIAPDGINAIGPFGWIGIAFLCSIVFAGATNFYLKFQKKKFEIPPTEEELKKLGGEFAK